MTVTLAHASTITSTWAPPRRARLGAVSTLARRRLTLSAGTLREVFVPLRPRSCSRW